MRKRWRGILASVSFALFAVVVAAWMRSFVIWLGLGTRTTDNNRPAAPAVPPAR